MPKQIKPKVTFYIDKSNRNKKGLAPIKANITINYKNISKIVDHTLPTDWNPKQQRVRAPRPGKSNNHDKINKGLDNIQKDFNEFIYNCIKNRIELSPDIAKRFLRGERSLTEKSFWSAYDEYISTLQVEPKTKQNYELYKTKLGEFEKDTGYYIDYHTVNTAFFERYQYYILSTKELSWNTFATAIKKLKFFLNWSLKMKYHKEKEYKEISAPEKEPTIIFLTMDELSTLYHYQFESKRLNQVRDKFCFGCFTSLAFSDLDKLTHEHINNGTLTKFRQKSKVLHDIELPDQAIKIIKRYQGKYRALPNISHQKFNKYIKECCKIAEINTPTIYKTFPKGIETENIAPKHELITAHVARKTFITNFYNETKDINLTKKNAAINQDKTLRRYMGTDKKMEKDAMKKAFGNL
jgi:site-specific recombinase XerD